MEYLLPVAHALKSKDAHILILRTALEIIKDAPLLPDEINEKAREALHKSWNWVEFYNAEAIAKYESEYKK